MKFKNLLLAVLAMGGLQASAQRTCTAHDHLHHQLQTNPEMEQNLMEIERFTQQFAANPVAGERAVITIPVVFHIIHNGDALGANENITDALINAQLDQLNKDFRKLNADASSVPSIFAGVAADAEIQFCLAKRTPTGAATTGINRLNKGQASWTMSQIESSLKPTTIWDRSKYLNLWTVIFGGSDAGTLGYAQFPGGTANTDGVVLGYSTVGSTAVANSAGGAYGKGRTATHEVGHWLNLRHIWGDANCGSDQVSDTPTHNTANYGCPASGHTSTCSGAPVEMTMNYMDYTDDACMYMFSTGQKTRMQALFASGGSRASLATSDGCVPPATGGTCATPSGLAAGSITATGATLSWTAVSGATSYNVQYKTSAATTWTTVTSTTNSMALTGLTASTTYNYQIQAVCSSTGAYSTAASFTTSAATGTCTDTYESNNTSSTAKTIARNTDITALIGTSTDKDYFKFTTTSTTGFKVKIDLTNLPADYDLKLYRGTTLVGTSQNTGTTAEQLIYNYTAAATYTVYVYGYNSAFNASSCYTLRASVGSTNFRTIEGLETSEENVITIEKEVNIFPNPVSGVATLAIESAKPSTAEVMVFDLNGQVVFKQARQLDNPMNELELDFTDHPNGVYYVRVAKNDEVVTRKVVVQH